MSYTSPLAEAMAEDLLERFCRYVRIDTESVPDPDGCPSTPGQLELARLLKDELVEIGLEDAQIDEHGYLFATLPGTVADAPVIGLLAHLDTSPDVTGKGVEPIVHRGYDGGVIELPKGGARLDPAEMPELREAAGHDVVTTSGDTLLGADDKAGMAEIMAAVRHLAAHPELPRATLRVGFTPDEEIGLGPHRFDVERFGARCAYTLDGSIPGELQSESFEAQEARITIHGVDIHPGTAKGVMVNAVRLAARILAQLPPELSPEATEEREGFIHPTVIEGSAPRVHFRVILRDFERAKLDAHAALLRSIVDEVAAAEPRARIELELIDQYPNMRTHLEATPEVVDLAERAIRQEGLEPVLTPIRGGTDGSQLSAMGLPTPNLFTGGHEYHSVREWASLQQMASAAAVIVHLAGLWADTTA